jgi:hypothetical protein
VKAILAGQSDKECETTFHWRRFFSLLVRADKVSHQLIWAFAPTEFVIAPYNGSRWQFLFALTASST